MSSLPDVFSTIVYSSKRHCPWEKALRMTCSIFTIWRKNKKKGCKEHFCTESYPLLKLWASFKAGIYWGLKIRRWNCMFNCKHCRKLWIFILVINFWHPIEIQVILENSAMSFWQESELLILLVCRKYKNYDGLTQGIFSLCYRKLLKVGESVGDRHCYLLLGQSISHWLEILPSGQW